MSSFKSNENIHKKEDGSYYVVSANKAKHIFKKAYSEVKPGQVHKAVRLSKIFLASNVFMQM